MSDFNKAISMQSWQSQTGSVGASQAQLVGVTGQKAHKGVLIKNNHASQFIYIGRTGVSATLGFRLGPAEEVSLELKHPDELYLLGSGAATTYTWLAY